MGKLKQKQTQKKEPQSESEDSSSDQYRANSDQQGSENIQQLSRQGSGQQEDEQLSDESSPIEAAIKTMKFRSKRGAKMKDLMKGKIDKDDFWEKNNIYFGGDLRGKDQDQHQSDYQASSSGRDQFDSDFDLTDSYPGKRGRKKGQKVKKKIVRTGTGRPRGRPRIVKQGDGQKAREESEEQIKEQKKEKKKKIYKQIPIKPNDAFIIYKAISYKKKATKLKNGQQKDQKLKEKQEDDVEA